MVVRKITLSLVVVMFSMFAWAQASATTNAQPDPWELVRQLQQRVDELESKVSGIDQKMEDQELESLQREAASESLLEGEEKLEATSFV